ncbi:MAG: MFS transporter [Rickettsiales bacterium]|nr:MFS transporter [Rickettsiales bacterium]
MNFVHDIDMSSSAKNSSEQAAIAILLTISVCHMLNDMMQSLIFAVYPILKNSLNLNFAQIGLIGFVYQCTASILQPFVGQYTDKNHKPYSLVFGMFCTLLGLLTLAFAHEFYISLIAVAIVGTGSSIFHPEASRIARLAGKGRHGFSQSFFQVGGNVGTALGPLLAAFIVLVKGQQSIALFCFAALIGMILLTYVGNWFKEMHLAGKFASKAKTHHHNLPKNVVALSFVVLVILIFSKFFYMESIKSYYTFYLIESFGLSIKDAQLHLFLFLLATAIGVLFGGIFADKYGRKLVIWVSILGPLPLTLALPYCGLTLTAILIFIIGLVMSSAFSAILVYAQELLPGKVGMVSGLFFGIGFGMAGIAAASLGKVADLTSIKFIYHICSFLPAIGLLTYFLPNIEKK